MQLPERWGVELLDVVPQPTSDEDWRAIGTRQFAWEAFAMSLVVRDRRAVSERTTEIVNDGLNVRPDEIFDALHAVAPDPAHPLNAVALHDYLGGMPMAERDAWWTHMHYHAFGDPTTAIDRLVRWAARGPYPGYPADVVELTGTLLAWVFASPNRFARDYTTKALATLLIGRLDVATGLVRRFADVDDPYVIQRVAAAALGAVARTAVAEIDKSEAVELLDTLVELVHSDQTLPDVLLRDHVAALGWLLAEHGFVGRTRLKRARGPYGSAPPKTPRKRDYLEEAFPRSDERDQGYGSLFYSALSEHSDWNRYVVSGRVDDFLPARLGAPHEAAEEPPDVEPVFKVNERAWGRLVAGLDERQAAMLTEESRDWDSFFASLSDEQTGLMGKVLVEPKRRRRKSRPKPMAYSPERAARFVYQRSVELGWRPELFAACDRSIANHDRGRDSHKPERFGKKYQWIALYELTARLADNFTYASWDKVMPYAAWRQNLRKIDPTLPPERVTVGDQQDHERAPTFPAETRPAWWTTGAPRFDPPEPGREGQWAQRRDDMPTPAQLVRVKDPLGAPWVLIEGYRNWRDDPFETATLEEISAPERDLAFLIESALIRDADVEALRRWLAEHPDLLRHLPDWGSQATFEAYLAELPAAQGQFGYPGGWRPRSEGGRLPLRTAATTLSYTSEGNGFDCSLSDSVSLEVPAKMLHGLLDLRWSEADVGWLGPTGDVVVQHRETSEGFHRDRALLLDEDILAEVLREHGLTLAIGLFSERRVFRRKSKHAMPDRLGWVDYVGHALFDGEQWTMSGFDIYKDRDE